MLLMKAFNDAFPPIQCKVFLAFKLYIFLLVFQLFFYNSLLNVFLSLSTNNGKANGLGDLVSFNIIFNFDNLSNELVIR